MGRGIIISAIVLTFVASACNTRPTPDAFDPSTTTTTVLDDSVASTTQPTLPPPEEQIFGTVVEVIDGDTVTVRIDGTPHDVRLLGINAPERDECWGPEARAYLARMISDHELLLVQGEEDTDQFGRILRYIFLEEPSGTEFVNADLVASGHALGMTNGHEYEENFKALEASAFHSGSGMWGTLVCGDAEGSQADRPVIRVTEIQFDPSGPDNEHLDEEYVTIVNEGYGRVRLSGWVLRDESSSNRFTLPPDLVLSPGESVTVVTGCSDGPPGAIHWCSDTAIWSNGGDTVILSDTLGNAVIHYAYSGA